MTRTTMRYASEGDAAISAAPPSGVSEATTEGAATPASASAPAASASAASASVASTPATSAGSADEPRARLENVSLTYDGGATWALNDLTLELRAGERLCVLGPNGSGKSTLAQVLCGLEAPDAGTVELAGCLAFDGSTPDADAYRAARLRTGLVFQNPEDQIVTSVVADDVAFGPENLGIPHNEIVRRVDEELKRVAMSAYALADPARLSGGQQQRVAIAGALAMHPDLLVLDEPGAMLDVRGRRGIMRVLDELQGWGATLVHITHFMDEALAADRVIVLAEGHIVLEGTPREVFAHAAKLHELGLDVPLPTHVALELGLPACCSTEELAGEFAAHTAENGLTSKQADEPANPSPSEETSQSITSGHPVVAAPRHSVDGSPILSIDHVTFRYGRTAALDDVSFAAQPGELVALVGQTGSGKSTLARLACALASPAAGTIEVCGIRTTDRKRRRELRGHVGYVMQHPERQLFAETVFDDIAYGPRNLGLDAHEVERRVNEQLDFLGLSAKAQASPFDLSGGQQRLVALAGVLAMEPELLVLDEPVAGLDPRASERLRSIIRALHERGRTILMISHSMEDVALLADHMVVLGTGHVALEGSPREVFAREERLHELGLGIPAPLALAHDLTSRGIAVTDAPLTAEALVNALRGAATSRGTSASAAETHPSLEAASSGTSSAHQSAKEARPC